MAAADPELAGSRRPRVLVTGFGPFPGAAENPTEALVARLAAPPDLAPGTELRLELLPVEYQPVPKLLAALGTSFAPDIAIHFGLSASAAGFQLERQAKNVIAQGKPDNAGLMPRERKICADGGDLTSSLPLTAIFEALQAGGLPVACSDDAGGYLCNYLFYQSRAHLCAGLAPEMSGFIHVPPLDSGIMTLKDMTAGAVTIIETCIRIWVEQTSAAASTGSP